MKNEILYIWLQLALGICSSVSRDLLIRFDDIASVYSCEDFSFLGEDRAKYIKRLGDKNTSDAFEVMKRCRSLGATVTGYYDKLYPDSLRLIKSPPVALYSIGNLIDLNETPCVAVVGTRNMSDYGKNVAENFAYGIAKSGAAVVSGLAKGIDTAAHRGAVAAGGFTVAVLGTPIGDVYPPENEKAFRVIYEKGLVLSEMYPKCPRTKADFPNRNRIISGISDSVVIAEAGDPSGALITARYALDQGKALYAVPGDIGASNGGTNKLIKSGVPAATSAYDVIAPLSLEYPEKIHPYEPSVRFGSVRSAPARKAPEEKAKAPEVPVPEVPAKPSKAAETPDLSGDLGKRIVSLLRSAGRSMTADDITHALGADAGKVLSELTLLEICGSVTSSAGGRFSAS